MTTDDRWTEIYHHLSNRNWSGALICADGLAETDERLAETVRWIVKRRLLIYSIDFIEHCGFTIKIRQSKFIGSNIKELVGAVQQEREYYR